MTQSQPRPFERPLYVPDVEELTGLSPHTLAHFRRAGKGPRWGKLGRRVVYARQNVIDWLEEQMNGGGVA